MTDTEARCTLTASRSPGSSDETSRTHWGRVLVLVLVGVCAAIQIGKVPPALPALQTSLGLSLIEVAWVMSLLSVIAAFSGCVAGSVASRIGLLNAALGSVLVMAAASAAGAMAQEPTLLLASRALEGLGFLMAVVSVPGLLAANSSHGDRQIVSALWGTYMGAGVAIALVFAPIILHHGGWRMLWILSALALLILAVALWLVSPRSPAPVYGNVSFVAIKRAALHKQPLLLAAAFAFQSFQWIGVFSFLPTILQEQGMAAQQAGNYAAGAVLANAAGNIAAGWMMKLGAKGWAVLTVAATLMAVSVLGIYSAELHPVLRFAMVAVFSLAAGLVPGAVFVRVRLSAAQMSAIPIMMGLIVQASQVAQLVSPPLIAALVSTTGDWHASPIALLPAAAGVFVCALLLRSSESSQMSR